MAAATAQTSPGVARSLRAIEELDLEPIVYKLITPEGDEPTMSLDQADEDVAVYRKFLMLHVLHPEAEIAPTPRIDAVWHAHLSDTSKYAADCQAMFGHFLHHFPYLGIRGEDDEDRLLVAKDTARALLVELGVPAELLAHCAGGACGACGPDDLSTFGERPRPVRVAA